jgi:hypothetical protein
MRDAGDIDGQPSTDPVIDLLSELAEVATRPAPLPARTPSTDHAEAGPT